MDQFANLLLSGLSTGSVYALVALGFNVIFKSTGAINFAQGEWVMMGGMVAAAAYAAHVPLGLAALCAIVAVVLVALFSERFIVRQLALPTPLAVTLIMIAVAICTKSLVMLVLGKNAFDLPGFTGSTPVEVVRPARASADVLDRRRGRGRDAAHALVLRAHHPGQGDARGGGAARGGRPVRHRAAHGAGAVLCVGGMHRRASPASSLRR